MRIKKFLSKGIVGCFNALAMGLVIQTANSACIWLIHQPEFPEEAKKFSRVQFVKRQQVKCLKMCLVFEVCI